MLAPAVDLWVGQRSSSRCPAAPGWSGRAPWLAAAGAAVAGGGGPDLGLGRAGRVAAVPWCGAWLELGLGELRKVVARLAWWVAVVRRRGCRGRQLLPGPELVV